MAVKQKTQARKHRQAWIKEQKALDRQRKERTVKAKSVREQLKTDAKKVVKVAKVAGRVAKAVTKKAQKTARSGDRAVNALFRPMKWW